MAGQRVRVLRGVEGVERAADYVAGLPVRQYLRALGGLPVEALHTLNTAQGLSTLYSVSWTGV